GCAADRRNRLQRPRHHDASMGRQICPGFGLTGSVQISSQTTRLKEENNMRIAVGVMTVVVAVGLVPGAKSAPAFEASPKAQADPDASGWYLVADARTNAKDKTCDDKIISVDSRTATQLNMEDLWKLAQGDHSGVTNGSVVNKWFCGDAKGTDKSS